MQSLLETERIAGRFDEVIQRCDGSLGDKNLLGEHNTKTSSLHRFLSPFPLSPSILRPSNSKCFPHSALAVIVEILWGFRYTACSNCYEPDKR